MPVPNIAASGRDRGGYLQIPPQGLKSREGGVQTRRVVQGG
ncbi:hypothetical protein [Neosynechococcus sphagnicola]|nr:hypothetical protein [Neosynechococcus sphagnicola]